MIVSIKKSIQQIKDAGFTHIKVELEGELQRGYDEYQYIDCANCEGTGYVHTTDDACNDYKNECAECDGEGSILDEESHNWGDEDECESFILNQLSSEARSGLDYTRFYNDGSVDSEMTFTTKIDNLNHCIEMINAFKALSDEVGQGLDVNGAGMHISLLTQADYPVRSGYLNDTNLDNFTREVTKLLPALYVASASGDFTRTLECRGPQISDEEKYSAIYTHGRTCLEYRIFETCYQRPEAFYEFIGTIAKTLEFYKDPTKTVETLGQVFPIYGERGLKGYTDTEPQIRILQKTLKHVIPEGYTLKKVTEDRGISLSLTTAKVKHSSRVRALKKAYKAYAEQYTKDTERGPSPYETVLMVEYRRRYPGYSDHEILDAIRGTRPMLTESEYITDSLGYRSVRATVQV